MKMIFKYPLVLTDKQRVSMPAGATPLTAQMQGGQITMWAVVDPEVPDHEYVVVMIGTGHEGPDPKCLYIGTVQHPSGLVLHVYFTAVP